MEIKASVKYVKTAPRKIRLACDLVQGKKLTDGISQLNFLKKQAAFDVLNVLESALANAKQKDLKPETLYIKEIKCDEGPSLKRSIYKSRGRMTPIKKRMSHIAVVLSDNRKSENRISLSEGSRKASQFETNSNNQNIKSKIRKENV